MRFKYWIYAIRPQTLAVSILPFFIYSSFIYKEFNVFHFDLVLFSLLTALFAQISTNLFNDALDGKNQLDTKERIGFKRMTSEGLLSFKEVFYAALFFLFLTALSGLYVVFNSTFLFLILGFVILCLTFLYSYSSFSLSRLGLGDIFVILFFGPVISLSLSYLQLKSFEISLLILGLQSGFMINVLLLINNLRDYKEDLKNNKKTSIVRYGLSFGKLMCVLMYAFSLALHFYWFFSKNYLNFFIPLILIYPVYFLIKDLKKDPSEFYNSLLVKSCLIYICFSILMSLSFLASSDLF